MPLGCVIAVGVGLLFFPRRAAKQLGADLRADVEHATALARSALLAYTRAEVVDDLQPRLEKLTEATASHTTVLGDAAREPGGQSERLLRLQRAVSAVDTLVSEVTTLVVLAKEGTEDSAPSLVRRQLENVAEILGDTADAARASRDGGGSDASSVRLNDAVTSLDDVFAAARRHRATVDYSTEELARLLAVVRSLHNIASVLNRVALAS